MHFGRSYANSKATFWPSRSDALGAQGLQDERPFLARRRRPENETVDPLGITAKRHFDGIGEASHIGDLHHANCIPWRERTKEDQLSDHQAPLPAQGVE